MIIDTPCVTVVYAKNDNYEDWNMIPIDRENIPSN